MNIIILKPNTLSYVCLATSGISIFRSFGSAQFPVSRIQCVHGLCARIYYLKHVAMIATISNRSSNFWNFTPRIPPETISECQKSKISLGGMPPDPPSRHVTRTLIAYWKYVERDEMAESHCLFSMCMFVGVQLFWFVFSLL